MTEKIGVLLPLQLETVFTAEPVLADDGSWLKDEWTMKLRVIPQPPSIDEHAPYISPGELDAVSRFRQTVRHRDKLDWQWLTDDHRAAFDELVTAVGGARAVWLLQNTTAVIDGGVLRAEPLDQQDDLPAQVRGLPRRLKVGVWTYTGGTEQLSEIGELPQGPGDIDPGRVPDLSDPDSVYKHWVGSFDLAKKAGLGGVFTLPDGLEPGNLGGVAVWGLGDDDPSSLLADHVNAGRLAELPLGTAASSVGGAPTTADEDWWATLLRRLKGESTSLDAIVARYLTGAAPPSLARSVTRDEQLREVRPDRERLGAFADPLPIEDIEAAAPDLPAETGLASLLLTALWPALWGQHAELGFTDPQAAADELDKIAAEVAEFTDWALEYVTPEGPLPAMRIGSDPYAVLPITRMSAWDPNRREQPESVAAIVHALREERAERHRELAQSGTVIEAGKQKYASLLARGGSSRVFGYRLRRRLSTDSTGYGFKYFDPEYQHWSPLGLAQTTSDQFFTDDKPADASKLPLVYPRRWPALEVEREWSWTRVPLAPLFAAVLGDDRWLRYAQPPNTGPWPATRLSELFPEWALFYASTDPRDPGVEESGQLRVAPESLLARLMLQSAFTMNRWRWSGGPFDPMRHLSAERGFEATRTALMHLAALLDPPSDEPWEKSDGERSEPIIGWTPKSTANPDAARVARLERALGAALDSVSTRIDPWLTGFAWQRLQAASATPDIERRLGAYGWVQGPFDGRPGPTDSGLLHAPSQAQAQVATLAFDKFKQQQRNEDDRTTWAMSLNASAVRIANELVADIRDGHHIREILGREVERIFGDLGGGNLTVYQRVEKLRLSFPMYRDRPDTRQTCDGKAALAGLLAAPTSATLPAQCRTELRELQAGLKAMADLHLLDGALNLLNGAPSAAAGNMNAAADSAPPQLRFPDTPTAARELSTTVLSVIPWRSAAPDDGAAALADPSVAGYLAGQLGTDWAWTLLPDDGGPAQTVTLTELGLRPIDTLAVSATQLRAAAAAKLGLVGVQDDQGGFAAVIHEFENRRWQVFWHTESQGYVRLSELKLDPAWAADLPPADLDTLVNGLFPPPDGVSATAQPVDTGGAPRVWAVYDALGNFLGAKDEEDLGIAVEQRGRPLDQLAAQIRAAVGAPGGRIIDPPELELATRLNATLGATVTAKDLPGAGQRSQTADYAELRERYIAVYTDLSLTIKQLRSARSTDQLLAAIRRAVPWGAAASPSPGHEATMAAAMARTPLPQGSAEPKQVAATLNQELTARFTATPAPSKMPSAARIAKPLPNYTALREQGIPDGVESLAKALAALATPQGNLAILTGWQQTELVAATGLSTEHAGVLDDDWLTTNATVRATMARLEALQLSGFSSTFWASSGDPWLTDEIAKADQLSDSGRSFGYAVPPLVAAFGPSDALDAEKVAVGMIDSWREDLPTPQRDTFAAFGFNAPAAQAPSAILLAVTPHAGDELVVDDLPRLLSELRASLVARTWRGPSAWHSSAWLSPADSWFYPPLLPYYAHQPPSIN